MTISRLRHEAQIVGIDFAGYLSSLTLRFAQSGESLSSANRDGCRHRVAGMQVNVQITGPARVFAR
ncbi:hypothetical protein CWS02_04130 [Enterobacter sp. EA-1]|nr:hypothetical protein CWS02_04130 [Enterobacter sp. EA-1]